MEIRKISKQTRTIILAVILLAVGVLFCFSTMMGINALSYIIGAGFIIAGVALIINSIIKKKSVLNYLCIIGAAMIAFGVFFMEYRFATILFYYVPWLLAFIGAVIIVDSILSKIADSTIAFVSKLIIGALVLALGLCLKFIPGFIDFSAVLLGIVMIVYAIYLLITTSSAVKS